MAQPYFSSTFIEGEPAFNLISITEASYKKRFQIKNASAFLPRRAWCEAPSLMRGCDPPCLSMRNNAPVEHCAAEAFNL